jgi:hypothetical protein
LQMELAPGLNRRCGVRYVLILRKMLVFVTRPIVGSLENE